MIEDSIQRRWDKATADRSEQLYSAQQWYARLLAMMADLHSPSGCPWDREQTLASLRQYIREEADEVCRAIDDILSFEDQLRSNSGLPTDDPQAPTTTDPARTPKKGKSIAHHPLHRGFNPQQAASGAPLPASLAEVDKLKLIELYRKLHNEVGDLLMQPVFLCEILGRMGHGGIERSTEEVVTKLIRRHPHVYGETEAVDSAQVLSNWEAIKHTEREQDI